MYKLRKKIDLLFWHKTHLHRLNQTHNNNEKPHYYSTNDNAACNTSYAWSAICKDGHR